MCLGSKYLFRTCNSLLSICFCTTLVLFHMPKVLVSNEIAICLKCLSPGHCIGSACHQCRAASLEKLYARVLRSGDIPLAIRKLILWTVIEHPAAAYRTKATQRLAWSMMGLLCRPAFIPRQMDWQATPVGTHFQGIRFVLFRNYKFLSARQRAANNSLAVIEFNTPLFWKGKRYDASLTCFQDFMRHVLSFLF